MRRTSYLLVALFIVAGCVSMKTEDVTSEQRAQFLDSIGALKTCGDQFAPESVLSVANQIEVLLSVTETDVASWLAREKTRHNLDESAQFDDIPLFILVGQLSVNKNCQQHIRKHIDEVAFADMKVFLAALFFLQGNRDAKVMNILRTAFRSGMSIDPREILSIEQVEQITAAINTTDITNKGGVDSTPKK